MSSHEKYTLIEVPTTNILSIVVKPHYSNNTPTHLLTSIIYIYITCLVVFMLMILIIFFTLEKVPIL